MSDNKKNQGDNTFGDQYIKAPTSKPIPRAAKFSIEENKAPKEEVKVESKPIAPKLPEKKAEAPKIVVPKIIKKDPELEKEIIKAIQEVPKEELEKLLKPNKASKEKLLQMDFQSRSDMSEAEKKDFIEQIAKREPEPEVAQVNGAMVWKWQQNRKNNSASK
ncbi:MAG: hypothetical protein ACK4IX_10620 [Candidatus Sericytochromatia bacterium]